MDGVSMAVRGEERSERIGTLVRYFRDYRGTHASYFSRFVACELLNLANVLGQMYFMDRWGDQPPRDNMASGSWEESSLPTV